MAYERKEGFKMSLSKTMEVLSIKDDLLKRKPKQVFETKKFKIQVLSNDAPEHTEMLYRLANGRNVLATFEKLRREIIDLHFAFICEKRNVRQAPVISYECKSSTKSTEISFVTRKDGYGNVTIHLKLKEQPRSLLSPNAPRGHYIRMEVGKKIPASSKLKESFNQFMNSGGLLIDFINDSLWPTLTKLKDQNESEQQPKKENERLDGKSALSHASRSFSGHERGSIGMFHNRSDGGHRGGAQPGRKIEGQNGNNRGPRIPRCTPQNSQPRVSKQPLFPQNTLPAFGPFATKLNNPTIVGGSFGPPKIDVLSTLIPNMPPQQLTTCQQAHRSDTVEENGPRRRYGSRDRGSRDRGRGGGRGDGGFGGSGRRGSETSNWRKNC